MTILIVVCQEIRKRFDMQNMLWRLLRYLHPRAVMDTIARAEMLSLSDFMNELRRLLPTYMMYKQLIVIGEVFTFINFLKILKIESTILAWSMLIQ